VAKVEWHPGELYPRLGFIVTNLARPAERVVAFYNQRGTAGDAEDGAAMVADQPARKADQDRREGREPRSLRDLPDGRGRGVGANVRRHPVADRPTAGTTHTSMRGAWSDVRQTTAAEVRLDAGKAPRFNVSTQFNWRFRHLLPHTERDLQLPRTLKETILASQRPGIRGMSV